MSDPAEDGGVSLGIVVRPFGGLHSPQLAEQVSRFIRRRLEHFLAGFDLRFGEAAADADVVVEISQAAPLQDPDLLRRAVLLCARTGKAVAVEGAVPGTAPAAVAPRQGGGGVHVLQWPTQRLYNSQVNLGRLRRQKMFEAFLRRFTDFHAWSTTRLMDFCGSAEGVRFLVAYGEDVEVRNYDACPLCGSPDCYDLHADGCQPITGFFTRQSVYYRRCGDCGLVFADPHLGGADMGIYYGEHEAERRYQPGRPDAYDGMGPDSVSHYENYRCFIDRFGPAVRAGGTVLDLGGGGGEFCALLKAERPDLAVGLVDMKVNPEVGEALARRGVAVHQWDFVAVGLPVTGLAAVTLWEVIEHVHADRLAGMLQGIHGALEEGGLLAFSTPDFADPCCRALDFWASSPGQHLTVLDRGVLEPLLRRCGFETVAVHHEAVTLKSAGRWFGYGRENAAALAARGEAAMIERLLADDDLRERYRTLLRDKGLGSELIMVCRKA